MSPLTRLRRRASVSLEFALVAPILVVLLVGVVEWGVVFAQEVALIQVVREAAHTGARVRRSADPAPNEVARARVMAALPGAGFQPGDATVLSQVESTASGFTLRLRVSVDRQALFSLVPSTDTLSAETVMRMEDQ